eukprot:gnl/TRDRNA2_/TRDRNA2_127931_c0_seq2.p1 gnl/TRDRNA2_/TRDRNA2_127931_c0~~gnl/TRDRNA2_/TRDRNA2_127931_c0_seq2.p1  ORF type:complete len:350 (+),score=37.13 gnl/TRDRNA2_/TRDRNA2_127931_c0_seq2:116-1165(+)
MPSEFFMTIILLAVVFQPDAKDAADKPDDDFVDKLVERGRNAWALHHISLENMMLAKSSVCSGTVSFRLQPSIAPCTGYARAPPSSTGPAPMLGDPHKGTDDPPRAATRSSMRLAAVAVSPRYWANSGAPEVLLDSMCLIHRDPVVRIEDVPGNAVRIFTGIDLVAPMQSVWDMLTDYDNLHKVVPNLVRNQVLQRYADGGARIAQTGGCSVLPGVSFTANMVLDVHPYREERPIPNSKLAAPHSRRQLIRGIFPQPYASTSLPHRDITMENVPHFPGDFEHYQGVWRVQPLTGCAPSGAEASRLTYTVEIKPKWLLPVKLIEGRIVTDLKANLMAMRKHVEAGTSRRR